MRTPLVTNGVDRENAMARFYCYKSRINHRLVHDIVRLHKKEIRGILFVAREIESGKGIRFGIPTN